MSNIPSRSGIPQASQGARPQTSGMQQPRAGTSGLQKPRAGTSASGLQQPRAGASGLQQPRAGASGLQQPRAGASGLQQPRAGASGLQQPRAGASGLQQPRPGTSGLQKPKAGIATGSGLPKRNIPASTFGKAKITVVEDVQRPKTTIGGGKKKKQSLMQWFDKNVEKSLQTHRNKNMNKPIDIGKSRGSRHPLVVSSSASGIDLTNRLRSVQHTDLAEAVEKLATAEAMCAFEGAVIAAEKAAQRAPPELAEEAAAAGARGYQSLITSVVREKIPGVKPIEVVGYVGITRPKRKLGSHK